VVLLRGLVVLLTLLGELEVVVIAAVPVDYWVAVGRLAVCLVMVAATSPVPAVARAFFRSSIAFGWAMTPSSWLPGPLPQEKVGGRM
jgi:hypothetical protein